MNRRGAAASNSALRNELERRGVGGCSVHWQTDYRYHGTDSPALPAAGLSSQGGDVGRGNPGIWTKMPNFRRGGGGREEIGRYLAVEVITASSGENRDERRKS